MGPSAIADQDSAERIEMIVPSPSLAVHLSLSSCALALLAFCLVAAPRGAFGLATPLIEAALLLLPPLLIPAAYCHERKSWERRDAILMLPWTLLLAALITQAAPTAVSLGYPLRDALWRNIDQHLGIRIPDLMAFTESHSRLQQLLTFSYYWMLHPLLLCAIFLPAITGKREAAQRFVLANAIAFVLALPCMVFIPAVGPWSGWHFAPNPLQRVCESTIQSLRGGSFSSDALFGGIICFPSFHVFWALIAAHALQPFRLLRYPAIAIAALITVSTMTTGWHYGVDLMSGILLAVISTSLAHGVFRVAKPSAT